MKQIVIYSIAALFLTTMSCAQGTKKNQNEPAQTETSTSAVEVSYALGVDVGIGLKSLNIEGFDVDKFAEGFKAAAFAADEEIDVQANRMVIQSFMTELQAKQTQTEPAQNAASVSVQEVSHAFGVDVAVSLKSYNLEGIDADKFVEGFKAATFAADGEIDVQANRTIIQNFMTELQAKKGEKNRIAGEEFLAKNKTEQGVVTTESGLQYKIIQQGTGAYPTAESTVLAFYKGMLIDGREFDASYRHGDAPAEFALNRVIKGWTEGIPKINEGGKIKLFIPYQLAYGTQQVPASVVIEPYSALIFEVELIKVK